MSRVVLVHGSATNPSVWDGVIDLLPELDVSAPARPLCGNLDREADWLEGVADGAIVFGMSGGATLALELAARGSRAAALIAHEPAAGSRAPDLFPPLARALAAGGVAAFGIALYGESWSADLAHEDAVVKRDLAMFRAFEPRAAAPGAPPTLVTTGALSPAVRHDLAASLSGTLGYRTKVVEGVRHFIAKESPEAVARLIRDAAEKPKARPLSPGRASGRA